MIEVKNTITITNDGSEWTLTIPDARELRRELDKWLAKFEVPPPWSGRSVVPSPQSEWKGLSQSESCSR
jgi:hypothetical protein